MFTRVKRFKPDFSFKIRLLFRMHLASRELRDMSRHLGRSAAVAEMESSDAELDAAAAAEAAEALRAAQVSSSKTLIASEINVHK